MILDSAGNLYGTTQYDGTAGVGVAYNGGLGVVYKLDTAGHETVLYSFRERRMASNPMPA